jgi:hypothetical protein
MFHSSWRTISISTDPADLAMIMPDMNNQADKDHGFSLSMPMKYIGELFND